VVELHDTIVSLCVRECVCVYLSVLFISYLQCIFGCVSDILMMMMMMMMMVMVSAYEFANRACKLFNIRLYATLCFNYFR